jgi:hypothetical protein
MSSLLLHFFAFSLSPSLNRLLMDATEHVRIQITEEWEACNKFS